MGAGHGTALQLIGADIELQRETKDFARWSLADVEHVLERFRKTFGFAITEAQFDNMLLLKAPDVLSTKEIFAVLDANHDGRLDGLEFLAALACVCRATFEEKARCKWLCVCITAVVFRRNLRLLLDAAVAFELFDFNSNGSLSLTELALVMKSVWMGMALFTGRSPPASETAQGSVARFLTLARSAFDKYDKDNSDALNYEEFIDWARSNREFMLQVEQFRLISEKAIGFEEEVSLPDGSDVDSDIDEEAEHAVHHHNAGTVASSAKTSDKRLPELPSPWSVEPTAGKATVTAARDALSACQLDFPPAINIELEWIYGCKGPSARGLCRYLCNGDVVYTLSKYAIVYQSDRHKQRYYQRHWNEIMCMDVHPSGEIVATGDKPASRESHPSPEIHVWNGLTMQCLVILQNFHIGGVGYLSFPAPASAASSTLGNNSTGTTSSVNASQIKRKGHTDTLLLSIGSDVNSSMALWNWQKESLVASGRAHPSKQVLACALNEDGNEAIVCGRHFIVFYHVEGHFFKQKKPRQMEKKLKAIPVCVSAAYFGSHQVVVGTAMGTLLQFNQGALIKVIQAHGVHQSVNCCLLSCRSMLIFTAGKDGVIKQWDSSLLPVGSSYDLHAIGSTASTQMGKEDWRINALDYDPFRKRLLLGTRCGHIIELLETKLNGPNPSSDTQTSAFNVIASSHGGLSISAISTTRLGISFASCGTDDRSVKLWSLRRRELGNETQLKFQPVCVMFSNDAESLAVGGAGGCIAILQSKTLTLVNSIKNTNSPVVCMRWSPQDNVLAVACANGFVYLYHVVDSGQRLRRFGLLKPTQGEATAGVPASSLDFTVDGNFLKSQHGSACLRFWDLRQHACTRITSMNLVRNMVWHSYSSTIGWHVGALQGNELCVRASSSQKMAFTITPTGKLSMVHFPCDSSKSASSLQKSIPNAHMVDTCAGSVGMGAFALHDTILVTSCGNDGAICQWRLEKEIVDEQSRQGASNNPTDQSILQLLEDIGLDDAYCGWEVNANFAARLHAFASHSSPQVLPMTALGGQHKEVLARMEAPDVDLSLCNVLGMNHSLCSIACAGNGSVVIAAGNLLVFYHVSQRKQIKVVKSGLRCAIAKVVRHPTDHVAAICSLESNRVMVHDLATDENLATIDGEESWRPIHLSFGDETGQLLAVIWKHRASKLHRLSIYAWKKNMLISQVDMTTLPVLFGVFTDCSSSSCVQFVSGGLNHTTFWRFHPATGYMHSQTGVFGRHALIDTITCAVFVAPYTLTGTATGRVIMWENACASYTVTAAETENSALMRIEHVSSRELVIAVAVSGQIVMWTYSKDFKSRGKSSDFLTPLRSLGLKSMNWKLPPGVNNRDSDNKREDLRVTTVCMQDELHGLVMATSLGAVLHLDSTVLAKENIGKSLSARVLFEADDRRNDVAVHPRAHLFASCTEDGVVVVHNMTSNAVVHRKHVGSAARSLTWNTSGETMAVSLATGVVEILNGASLEHVTDFACGQSTANDGLKKWCSKIRFSPTDKHLVLACRDYNLYVYGCVAPDKYDLLHVLMGHTVRIETLDFSCNGLWVQSSSGALDKQMLRWSLEDPNKPSTCQLSDDDWFSWSNAYAGPLGGLSELFGMHCTAVDRVQPMDMDQVMQSMKWSSRIPVVAVGTDNGDILLYWYPFPCGRGKSALSKEYSNYIPSDYEVTSLQFSYQNTYLVVCARNNRGLTLVLVWNTDYEEELQHLERFAHTAGREVVTEADDARLVDPLLQSTNSERDKGDEFLAVKPWLGAIREPSNIAHVNKGELPDEELALEFVYGVNVGQDGRNDVSYADDAWEIVYSSAAIGIVYNTKTQTQLFNQAHGSNAVSALAVHPQGTIIATGECDVKKGVKLALWDANSGSTICQVATLHERGIALLAFSSSGDRLAAIGMDNDHTLSLYSLATGDGLTCVKLLATMKSSKQQVWGLCLSDDNELVTCGANHILFWELATKGASAALNMKKGLLSSHKRCSTTAKLKCAAFVSKNLVVSGQTDGSLYVWKGRNCVDVKTKAHADEISSVFVDQRRRMLFSGGKDGMICVWDQHIEPLRTFDLRQLRLTSSIPLMSYVINSVCARDGRVLISTAAAEICEIVPDAQNTPQAQLLRADCPYHLDIHIRGHCKGELWGLAAHPTKMQFATAGDDGTIRLWDAPARQLLAMYRWGNVRARAIAFSSEGNHVAVGSIDGKMVILTEQLDSAVMEWKCSPKSVQVIKYSPDNATLAIGCHDQKIHIYDAHTCKKQGELKGHSSTVLHMDFSKDGTVLQSTSSSYELLFWDVGTMKQIQSSSTVRDVVWATWTCPFGWPAQGIWPTPSDGSDVNAVCRSSENRFLVSADDQGYAKLFKYPCTAPHASFRSYEGHSAHVTNCVVTSKDMFVVSTGGRDKAVCQFHVRRGVAKPA
ncbi:TPA: hypothetical protein N0F65_004217 [Lagenidium giganteum]|uniref:EF-hand domain-containing protein n=1 Tax=Lagenidium giganteum TaxID=4803 RepID=A0AAV2ZGD3_9STRA|nr:TPA: hypothetical protein N0F65_004217 [Lagenidium giganteum]